MQRPGGAPDGISSEARQGPTVKSGSLAVLPAALEASDDFVLLFPHFVEGGGYATTFTFINRGATRAAGVLTVFDSQGNPGDPIQISIDPNGATSTEFFRHALRTGWAKFEGAGGEVAGMITYKYFESGALRSAVGVLAGSPAQSVLIPVDNSSSVGVATAYAIVNHGSKTAEISLSTYDKYGSLTDSGIVFRLPPGHQIAKYLHEDLPARIEFFGSMALTSINGEPFSAVGLQQNQHLFSAIPVISR
jgi:hypothetical protein